MTKITSYTVFQTAEGTRLSYTYSKIDENGNITESNVRKNMIVMDEDLNNELNDVFTFLTNREAATE